MNEKLRSRFDIWESDAFVTLFLVNMAVLGASIGTLLGIYAR